MAIAYEKLESILREKFPRAKIEIVDMVGDQDHYSITITDDVFKNKTRVEQHKIVNEALKNELKAQLHAMQLKTKFE